LFNDNNLIKESENICIKINENENDSDNEKVSKRSDSSNSLMDFDVCNEKNNNV
jgi:hypothetical protein